MSRLSNQLTKRDGGGEQGNLSESRNPHVFKGCRVIAEGINKKEKHHACPSDRDVR
jgi:hypothetical protein